MSLIGTDERSCLLKAVTIAVAQAVTLRTFPRELTLLESHLHLRPILVLPNLLVVTVVVLVIKVEEPRLLIMAGTEVEEGVSVMLVPLVVLEVARLMDMDMDTVMKW